MGVGRVCESEPAREIEADREREHDKQKPFTLVRFLPGAENLVMVQNQSWGGRWAVEMTKHIC